MIYFGGGARLAAQISCVMCTPTTPSKPHVPGLRCIFRARVLLVMVAAATNHWCNARKAKSYSAQQHCVCVLREARTREASLVDGNVRADRNGANASPPPPSHTHYHAVIIELTTTINKNNIITNRNTHPNRCDQNRACVRVCASQRYRCLLCVRSN